MLSRKVEPELLDQVPADDPVALKIHRDILRYNRLMGNFRWVGREVRRSLRQGDRVLEIAAGQGHLLNALAKRKLLTRAGHVAAFDAACSRPELCPEGVEWSVCRAEDFSGYRNFDVILVCHFLHQLSADALQALGEQLAHARVIIAAEPRRHPLAVRLCKASRLIGFSQEGICDAYTSIHAGFRRDELTTLLGLDAARWGFNYSETWLGSYRLRAERIQKN